MIGEIRGRSADRGVVVPEAVAAVQHLEALGHEQPILLAYHPVARVNPYQALLYAHGWRHGVAPVPLYRIAELDQFQAVAHAAGVPAVVHLHWTSGVLWRAETDEEARNAIDRYLARLDAFVAAGGRIVWTVHNVLPHDALRPALEAELQQGIVDRATIVHTLATDTASETRDWFRIPDEKVLHVPHPSYTGAYRDTVTREVARYELGIGPDEIVYAVLGAIKPYKGIERLLDAFDVLTSREPARRRLIVAGAPDKAGAVDELLLRCELHPFVLLHALTVPADDMQLFLRAADLVVLPYHRTLNSGVLMLALTFGAPVVAPAMGGVGELITSEIGRTFDPESDDALLEALAAADALLTPAAREAARRAAEQYDPARISEAFIRGLAERIRAASAIPA
jgi:glycosyltransferase involved in cell wall biosynthesis